MLVPIGPGVRVYERKKSTGVVVGVFVGDLVGLAVGRDVRA